MELLTNNHKDVIFNLFDEAETEIKIISPFLGKNEAEKLVEVVRERNLKCTFITRFYLEDMYAKANSIEAIELMMNAGIEVYAVKGLHTKLYLVDNEGIVGSANFTTGGFKSNIELSILFDEDDVVLELNEYFDNLLSKIKENGKGKISYEVLEVAKSKYNELLKSREKDNGKRSTYMYGAELDKKSAYGNDTDKILAELDRCKTEKIDVVSEVFKSKNKIEKKVNSYNSWLKFEGRGSDRKNPNEKYNINNVYLGGDTIYLFNYSRRPSSVNEGDVVYIAPLSFDKDGKNQPMIVGKGHLKAFKKNNNANNQPEWIKKYPWMENVYPWYCIVEDHFIIDTEVKNGIPLREIWDRFGSDTYEASFGKEESYPEVAKKHRRRGHIRLSGNVAEYIDKRLDELIDKYGAKYY